MTETCQQKSIVCAVAVCCESAFSVMAWLSHNSCIAAVQWSSWRIRLQLLWLRLRMLRNASSDMMKGSRCWELPVSARRRPNPPTAFGMRPHWWRTPLSTCSICFEPAVNRHQETSFESDRNSSSCSRPFCRQLEMAGSCVIFNALADSECWCPKVSYFVSHSTLVSHSPQAKGSKTQIRITKKSKV